MAERTRLSDRHISPPRGGDPAALAAIKIQLRRATSRAVDKEKIEQIEVKNQITTAQDLLSSVTINEDLRLKISTLCSELKIDGLRGDLVVNRCSKAYAALQGKSDVDVEHIQKIINLCLSHRLRKDPLDLLGPSAQIEEKFAEIF